MKIDRTLFWFNKGKETQINLSDRFFALGNLLNRLLNEEYTGKKIKFINIEFNTQETYDLVPILPKNESYYSGGHLKFYGLIELTAFNNLTFEEQKLFIWNRSYEYIQISAKTIRNAELLEASSYAYKKGLELKLNPDYRMVEENLIINGQELKAAVWVNFREDGMYSIFTLEKSGVIIFKKSLDKTKLGVEFFLEMYKSIQFDHNKSSFVIKGRKDASQFPIIIPIRVSNNGNVVEL